MYNPCIAIDVSKGKSHIQGFLDNNVKFTNAKPIKHNKEGFEGYAHREFVFKYVLGLIDQLDEPEVLPQEWIDKYAQGDYDEWVYTEDLQNLLVPNQEEVDRAYRKGFKEGERQTAEYFESITEEPSKEQVWKYLSEHGIEVVDKEPETVADVVADFFKSLERLKEVMSMEVEELEK